MNWPVALSLIPLLALLALASYVDRVYQEIGKFLSREFQDNIDVFEQKVEPQAESQSRPRRALHVRTQAVDHRHDFSAGWLRAFQRPALDHLRNLAGRHQPDRHHHRVQPVSAFPVLLAHQRHVADPVDMAADHPDLSGFAGDDCSGLPAIRRLAHPREYA